MPPAFWEQEAVIYSQENMGGGTKADPDLAERVKLI